MAASSTNFSDHVNRQSTNTSYKDQHDFSHQPPEGQFSTRVRFSRDEEESRPAFSRDSVGTSTGHNRAMLMETNEITIPPSPSYALLDIITAGHARVAKRTQLTFHMLIGVSAVSAVLIGAVVCMVVAYRKMKAEFEGAKSQIAQLMSQANRTEELILEAAENPEFVKKVAVAGFDYIASVREHRQKALNEQRQRQIVALKAKQEQEQQKANTNVSDKKKETASRNSKKIPLVPEEDEFNDESSGEESENEIEEESSRTDEIVKKFNETHDVVVVTSNDDGSMSVNIEGKGPIEGIDMQKIIQATTQMMQGQPVVEVMKNGVCYRNGNCITEVQEETKTVEEEDEDLSPSTPNIIEEEEDDSEEAQPEPVEVKTPVSSKKSKKTKQRGKKK